MSMGKNIDEKPNQTKIGTALLKMEKIIQTVYSSKNI